jgi:hypothetical protein
MIGMPVKKTDLGTLEPLAKGGFGEVFRVGGNPLPGDRTPLAYKEFTADFDMQRRSALAAVAFRDGLGQTDRDDLDRCTAWPRELVLDSSGEISGLLMRLIPDDFFCELLDSTTGKKDRKVRDIQWLGATRVQRDAAEIDLRDIEPLERLILLGKLVYAVGRLHKHGWVFGDLSFKNAAFALDPPRMMLLDCDGAAALSNPARKQASTPNWDPPECPINVPAGQQRQQDLQDDVTDVYKLGLAILRCLTPGKGMTSTRNPGRLKDQLDGAGIALVKRALGANRSDRPTAKELYAYFYQVVTPLVHPPVVRYARLLTPMCVRGMDARIEWRIENASEVTVTVGDADPRTVDLDAHPDGCAMEKPRPGPVLIEVTNKFGTLRVDLGQITLYELPAFTPFDPRGLPRPWVPRLEAFSLEHMRPVLDAVPAMRPLELTPVPSLPTAELISGFKDTLMRGAGEPLPLPRLNEAVTEASRMVMGFLMDEAKKHAAAQRHEYLANNRRAGDAQP